MNNDIIHIIAIRISPIITGSNCSYSLLKNALSADENIPYTFPEL
jgi:hypothetical protein